MKKYIILQNFSGSQLGYTEPEHFEEGSEALLTDYLGEIALQYKYAKLAEPEIQEAESRETKVIAEMETKPARGRPKKAVA